ncbi:MAG: helicase [Betaproteobacteria bacterium]|nr:helicase [Betaproteobacteria bacterium]
MSYADFIATKTRTHEASGIVDDVAGYDLMPHQVDLTRWALRRGRAAIFADTGLGKTRMQLAWADTLRRRLGVNTLILAPLAVAQQTAEEGAAIGVPVTHVRYARDVVPGICVTNYDRLHLFDATQFQAVVLDESSCIKHHTAKTLQQLLDAFAATPYKLCATATPAPNDWAELGTHAEFLGVRSRVEMLAEFFVHDGAETQVWRLKGHARDLFWQWVAHWGALVRSPADLGHDASMYELPPLTIAQHVIEPRHEPIDGLFHAEAQTLMERRNARRGSIADRVAECAAIVNSTPGAWVIWCDLNAEGDALRAAIPDAVEIRGADDADEKERRLHDFAHGRTRVLVTKPSIAGWGLNWQHCAQVAFVGVTDSYEAYYQAVRRCWRFGQQRQVDVHIFSSATEGAVLANLQRKEVAARSMAESLSSATLGAVRNEVLGLVRESNEYQPAQAISIPDFLRAA